MSRVFIGLGTNVGDRAANLRNAIHDLDPHVTVEHISSVYETEPVGFREQRDFWNIVLSGTTQLAPATLMQSLLEIERARGRERTFRNAPRVIDIDILMFDDVVREEPDLVIPHPRMTERGFVLRPLLEIAPDARDPRTGFALSSSLYALPPDRVTRLGSLENVSDS